MPKLGTSYFYGCSNLSEVDCSSVTDVGSGAFRGCTQLQLLDLPAATNISTNAFYGDTLLTTLILRHSAVCKLSSTSAFTGTPIESGTGYIYVPDDLVDSYKIATNWSTYANQIKAISELEAVA